MITAQVGKEIINCFDEKYDRYKLKEWSKKKILKCPACGSLYEYCHGDIVKPYFRHINKECVQKYSESESQEHIKGKELLYKWISKQDGVVNCELEKWIPETKQRPDIYFEKGAQRYVIEFQCTPIATEYLERRELYRLAGIKDIWILGMEKYNHDSKRIRVIDEAEIILNVNSSELSTNFSKVLDINNYQVSDEYWLEKRNTIEKFDKWLALKNIKYYKSYARDINQFYFSDNITMSNENKILELFNVELNNNIKIRKDRDIETKKRHEENMRKYNLPVDIISDNLNVNVERVCGKSYSWYLHKLSFEYDDRRFVIFIKKTIFSVTELVTSRFDKDDLEYKKLSRNKIEELENELPTIIKKIKEGLL